MTKVFDHAGLPEATKFIQQKLSAFDLSKLDRLTFNARLTSTSLSWRVKKPERSDDGKGFKSQFQLTCSVRGETDVEQAAIPLVFQEGPTRPPLVSIVLPSRAERLVFASAAGCYLYLRRTRQIPGTAANWMARRFAIGWVHEFAGRSRLRFHDADITDDGDILYMTCFCVPIPRLFVNSPDEQGEYFGSAVSSVTDGEVELFIDRDAHVAAEHSPIARSLVKAAIANAIDRTFGDCEVDIINELKSTDDPEPAWNILADWLEERDDKRAFWIRSHRLDLAKLWMSEFSSAHNPTTR